MPPLPRRGAGGCRLGCGAQQLIESDAQSRRVDVYALTGRQEELAVTVNGDEHVEHGKIGRVRQQLLEADGSESVPSQVYHVNHALGAL